MKICDRTPAELNGLQYIEGTLPALDADRFEEHYFNCPACLNYMETLQTAAEEFVQMPPVAVQAKRWSLISWPLPVWSLGAVAALLLIGFFVHKSLEHGSSQPTVARNQSPPQIQATAPQRPEPVPAVSRADAVPVRLSELADLTLPTYQVPALRGERLDARFVAGMKEYVKGNCGGAIQSLSQLPAEDAEARTAAFYAGACQMHLGNFDLAATLLHKVADTENSPRQEAALYLLAQISLTENDPTAAHTFLGRTISLDGDLLERARAEDIRITTMQKKVSRLLQKKPHSK
jgi:hypothetical protein